MLATAAATRPIDVLVELGAPAAAPAPAASTRPTGSPAAVAASDVPAAGRRGRLRGRARPRRLRPERIAAVRDYLAQLAELHRGLLAAGAYQTDEIIVTAGGSAYFDDVAEVLGELATEGGGDSPAVRVLCARAPTSSTTTASTGPSRRCRRAGTPLRSAMHAWARVVSRPEPGLALLDAGKRDIPFDEGLPEPQLVADDLGAPTHAARPARTSPRSTTSTPSCASLPDSTLRVGEVVRLGLSHPCTAFDKWRWIPVVPGETPAPRPTRSSSTWSAPTSDAPHLDSMRTLIRAATVVDGTETPRYRADVLRQRRPDRRDPAPDDGRHSSAPTAATA